MTHRLRHPIRQRAQRLTAVSFALLASACFVSETDSTQPGGDPADRDRPEAEGGRGAVALPDVGGELYFLVTRPDLKKCMWPMCGGNYVRAVNRTETTCLGGAAGEDCYVAAFDTKALGLDDEARVLLDQAIKGGRALVRGKFAATPGPFAPVASLEVSEAWRAQSPEKDPALESPGFHIPPPAGDFYGVLGTGIVCITYPCPTLSETKLNTLASDALSGLELSATGASEAALEAASAALVDGRILVAGTHQPVVGPGGQSKQIVASELYLAVLPSPAGEPCGLNSCGAGETCCNASCGICVPEGGACIQIACQCTHDECNAGGSLDAQCSPCTAKVCEADAYCCDTAWDSVCVDEAEELCEETCGEPEPEPEPEPSCAHDTCEAGAALEADCSPCAASVCAADAFCCDVKWDGLCAQEASDLCGPCEAQAVEVCAHSVCAEGQPLTDTCSSCSAIVCAQDAFCCDVEWDAICVEQAEGCGVCN